MGLGYNSEHMEQVQVSCIWAASGLGLTEARPEQLRCSRLHKSISLMTPPEYLFTVVFKSRIR
ncbi:conserved hypothetical protein [Ricinus communis]|uniref:Uncharacterized protein n=1 Tax=Ricinus communis TaxID=3988 RepID=B9RFE4_RICCO|nr:conserved hypothetical protein [Ricinus communis]